MITRVVFRTDASAEIGTGHLRRCLSLAQALRARGVQCSFMARKLGVDVAALVARESMDVHWLPPPADTARMTWDLGPDPNLPAHAAWARVPWAEDARQTLAAMSARRPTWVVVDHYAFDAAWHRVVATGAACRLAAIDDLGDRPLAVDCLIDHNLAQDHARKYQHQLLGTARSPKPRMLTGPRHALLGPAYATAKRCQPGADVRSIGVFMGGVDAAGASLLALQALRQAGFQGEVEVVSTTANPGLAELRAAVAGCPRARLSLDLPDLTAFYARHDLQLGAGGGATWERCCIGAPTLAVVLAENQQAALRPLSGMGVLQTATTDVHSVAQTLRRLFDSPEERLEMARRARLLVDGQGAARVAAALMEEEASAP